MKIENFFAELKRRNVYKGALAVNLLRNSRGASLAAL